MISLKQALHLATVNWALRIVWALVLSETRLWPIRTHGVKRMKRIRISVAEDNEAQHPPLSNDLNLIE